MELTVRRKGFISIRKCIPAFVNLFGKGKFIMEYNRKEVLRDMKDYDVFLKPKNTWMDLTYAHEEGFLDSSELRRWK
jgi:hypothetical protein